jgi:hypothetical protein
MLNRQPAQASSFQDHSQALAELPWPDVTPLATARFYAVAVCPTRLASRGS